MGYSTDFKGQLKFSHELTASQLAALKGFLGEDSRDHPSWGEMSDFMFCVQFGLLDDFSGIEWDGSEKFSGAIGAVNALTMEMQKLIPDFCFTGKLLAQGEDIDDRWELRMKYGEAVKVAVPTNGTVVACPQCGYKFHAEEE